ncbi:APH(3') family aminoglycoside O-phosphotransferase [Nocardiopsis trehalosi]|jgi:kanamycin kinase/aminoglycoside 3'-phosphotransferase-2|uniref:APH(3') family aminoglycoside O-phosphotransferase n=1 Tax=Nocardiopsis trehalosi TaxID=109329 RepID=UPI000830D676|nr:APH(3') family aminoglycoside O-phosphotransferase [Nocardiopsis trehalosi]
MSDAIVRRLRRRHPFAEWTPVTVGLSGARVWRVAGRGRTLYVKVADDPAALRAEAERSAWLRKAGIGAPEAVEGGERDGSGWLVTAAVPGRTLAEAWPAHLRAPAVAAFARLARRLHDLPVEDCPFDRGLAVTVPRARAATAAGRVDSGAFEPERRGRAPEDVLAELEAAVPATEDRVVCHGDLCLPNVLVDPDTLEWTGVVDTARVGVADRNHDLGLACRSLGDTRLNPDFGPAFVRAFLHHYGEQHVDPDRMAFYRLLDEFF